MPDLTAVIDLIGALTTVMLVLVTAWYAITTRKMARSAKDSAESSRAAADASLRAAEAAVARVPVEFTVGPFSGRTGKSPTLVLGFAVGCVGATVFVHGCTLERYGVSKNYDGMTVELQDGSLPVDLFPSSRTYPERWGRRPASVKIPALPRKLHRGEHMLFELPTEVEIPLKGFWNVSVTVFYSIDGASEAIPRQVHGTATKGNPPGWSSGRADD